MTSDDRLSGDGDRIEHQRQQHPHVECDLVRGDLCRPEVAGDRSAEYERPRSAAVRTQQMPADACQSRDGCCGRARSVTSKPLYRLRDPAQ